MPNPMGGWQLLASAPNALAIVGVHAVVLHTGKVLFFCFDASIVGKLGSPQFNQYFNDASMGSYQIWDPATQTPASVQEVGRNVFCGGQCTLADGTIFVAGGQDAAGAADLTGQGDKIFDAFVGGTDNGALQDVHTYDPVTDSWISWPKLANGRYYPTCLTLGDGTAFVAAGLSNLQAFVISGDNWCQNDQFETFANGQLGLGPSPQQKFMSADQYPIIKLLPGSQQLFVHIHRTTLIFDLPSSSFVDGAQFIPPEPVGRQTYPMQTGHVLLPQKQGDAPRILIVGGSTATGYDSNTHSDAPAVQGAFVFEYNSASPVNSRWRATNGAPNLARLLGDTVLLPDGTVFVVNGISQGAASGHSGATVFTPEIFDPVTETFTVMNDSSHDHPRAYHSTAVLLPDATVAIAGNTAAYNQDTGEPHGIDDTSIEIFSPPYLFDGPRPLVTGVQSSFPYGGTLTIDNSGSPTIDRVIMMRPCAVTHTVDMDQRAIWLVTGPGSNAGLLSITFPTDTSLAPPGPYMLFFLAKGIPSVASWIFLGSTPQGGGGGGPNCSNVYPANNLGPLDGLFVQQAAYPGNVNIDKIDNGFRAIIQSQCGSITINHKIDQGSYANLNAFTTFTMGETIDQNSIVYITANGDISIALKVDQGSQATLISTAGKIDIGQKLDQHCSFKLQAGTTVHIGQKIDQHAHGTIIAQGDVTIDQGIDQWATPDITSLNGNINIGQAVDGNATATLRAPNGSITIGQKVAGGATVNWHAQNFSCPDTSGGHVNQF